MHSKFIRIAAAIIVAVYMLGISFALAARISGRPGVSATTPGVGNPQLNQPQPIFPVAPQMTPPVRRVTPSPIIPVQGDIEATDVESGNDMQKGTGRFVNIDFDNVDMSLFIKFMSELTGKNFIVDDKVRGKVTIISPKKITVEEAYKVFESVLEVYGYATVPSGNVTKVIPAPEARTKSIETLLEESKLTADDKVVTQLIPLKYANPEEVKKLLQPLIGKSSLLISYAPTQTLFIIDVLSNIQRIMKIVEAIDIEGVGEEINTIPIKHASAANIAKSLSALFSGNTPRGARLPGMGPTNQVKIVPDERTNLLIVLAPEDDVARMKKLVELLDIDVPTGTGDIHVYYLQNASAEELLKVLTSLPTGDKTSMGPAGLMEGGDMPFIPPGMPGEPQGDGTPKRTPVTLSKDVKILADKATNALIITANRVEYAAIEDIIKKLDIPRNMVYIEALIMEVNVEKSFSLGVEWQTFKDVGSWDGKKLGVLSSNRGTDASALAGLVAGTPNGFSLGVAGEAITIGSMVFPSIGAVVQAYQKDKDVHIISAPQILTTNNEEAEIKVGENVPFITKKETTTAQSDYSSYEYKDVGVSLKITPQINQERFVRLNIFQEVTKLIIEGGKVSESPRTLKRSAKTTVIIKDQNTIVIGGLIGEDTTRSNAAMPCLGNIPGLGWLFKNFTKLDTKTNLFIFITPHIIANSDEMNKLYQDKKQKIDSMKSESIKLYKK
ncbi:MAG: type II secretion system secretin GspD [Pseudomonadota bacterium]